MAMQSGDSADDIARSIYRALGVDYGGGGMDWETIAAMPRYAGLRYNGTRDQVVAQLAADGFTAPDFEVDAMTDQINVWRIVSVDRSGCRVRIRRRRAFTLMP